MSESTSSTKQLLIPGKLFTGLILLLLLSSLGVLVPVSLRFEFAQDCLEETRQRWPQAALQLETRYETARTLSENGVLKLPAEWSSLHRRFEQSVLYDEQRPHSRLLERVLITAIDQSPQLAKDDRDRMLQPFDSQQYREFIESERRLQTVYTDFLGRITSTLFRLKLP